MHFIKIWLCVVGIHLPIRGPRTLRAMNNASCACGQKHWRWFER